MASVEDYLSGLWQAIQGNTVPQAAPTAQPATSPNTPALAPTPQSGGFMQSAGNFLSNPMTQGALASYFGAIGSPKRAGVGGMISSGGLTGLNAYNNAENAQQKQAEQALAIQKAQLDAQKAQEEETLYQQKQKVYGTLTDEEKKRASFADLGTYEDKAAIELNNKNAVAAFQAGHPNDTGAAAFSAPYGAMQTAVTPGDIEKDYQEKLQGPSKQKELTASIAEKEAATQHLKSEQNRPQPGTIANWYDPKTKQYYRGAQKSPTDIPASVAQSARSDQEIKARATAWQKAYQDARTSYIKTGTKTGYFGGKTPPSETDVDAYAKQQADAQVNALFGSMGTPAAVAAAAGAGADEAAPPLPEGSTAYAVDKDGNVGHVDSSGNFVPF